MAHLQKVILLYILCTLVLKATSYIVTLDARAEECFFERAIAGTKLGFTFEVLESGLSHIYVTIRDPDHQLVHQEPKATFGKYTIEANKDGQYKYCLSNKMSVTPKVVMFSIETASQIQHKLSGTEDRARLSTRIRELSGALANIKLELSYLYARDLVHRRINETTNSTVVAWTWIELAILLSVSFGQVAYIKRFFEVRRAI